MKRIFKFGFYYSPEHKHAYFSLQLDYLSLNKVRRKIYDTDLQIRIWQ